MFKKTIFQNTVNKHRTQDTEHRHRTQNTNTANFRSLINVFHIKNLKWSSQRHQVNFLSKRSIPLLFLCFYQIELGNWMPRT